MTLQQEYQKILKTGCKTIYRTKEQKLKVQNSSMEYYEDLNTPEFFHFRQGFHGYKLSQYRF